MLPLHSGWRFVLFDGGHVGDHSADARVLLLSDKHERKLSVIWHLCGSDLFDVLFAPLFILSRLGSIYRQVAFNDGDPFLQKFSEVPFLVYEMILVQMDVFRKHLHVFS